MDSFTGWIRIGLFRMQDYFNRFLFISLLNRIALITQITALKSEVEILGNRLGICYLF